MAEFLVKAKPSWNGKGKEVGDIVVVRPDGWKWGNKECPPDYIIVKLPSMSFEDAKEYEKKLTKTVYVQIDDTDGIASVPEERMVLFLKSILKSEISNPSLMPLSIK